MNVDENRLKWMKVGQNWRKWMKVDDSGWKWMKASVAAKLAVAKPSTRTGYSRSKQTIADQSILISVVLPASPLHFLYFTSIILDKGITERRNRMVPQLANIATVDSLQSKANWAPLSMGPQVFQTMHCISIILRPLMISHLMTCHPTE